MTQIAAPSEKLTLGFVPLLDAAPLIVAREQGFFRAEGLHVVLSREPSWSSLRDKVSVGLLQGGQMLSPMPLAATLGLGGLKTAMLTGLALSVNGNAITLASDLHQALIAQAGSAASPEQLSRALQQIVQQRHQPLRLATVYPYSSHHYQLHSWLRMGGIDPERDIKLIAVPPPRMTAQLRSGAIDGYCVGEPWNSLAELEGIGRITVTGYQLWPDAPEKVLGVTRRWAESHPSEHLALIRALLRAAQWIAAADNREPLMRLLALPPYLDRAAESLLSADYLERWGEAPLYQRFWRNFAGMPWRDHGQQLLQQIQLAGQCPALVDDGLVEAVYQPQLYRQAAQALKLPVPERDQR